MDDTNGNSATENKKSDIGFKLGRCSRCASHDLSIIGEKIICRKCNDWAWLDDAKYSCWNGYCN
jgi:hypothetical protein